jgi:hypothetical protein
MNIEGLEGERILRSKSSHLGAQGRLKLNSPYPTGPMGLLPTCLSAALPILMFAVVCGKIGRNCCLWVDNRFHRLLRSYIVGVRTAAVL